jgi:hypothetical protein
VWPVRATLDCWRGHGRSAALAAVTAAALTTTPVATSVGFLPSLRAYNHYATLASIQARTVVISGRAPISPSRMDGEQTGFRLDEASECYPATIREVVESDRTSASDLSIGTGSISLAMQQITLDL